MRVSKFVFKPYAHAIGPTKDPLDFEVPESRSIGVFERYTTEKRSLLTNKKFIFLKEKTADSGY